MSPDKLGLRSLTLAVVLLALLVPAGCDKPGGFVAPVCGNAVVMGSEECDDGNLTDGDGCSSTCLLDVSGNYAGVATVTADSCGTGAGTAVEFRVTQVGHTVTLETDALDSPMGGCTTSTGTVSARQLDAAVGWQSQDFFSLNCDLSRFVTWTLNFDGAGNVSGGWVANVQDEFPGCHTDPSPWNAVPCMITYDLVGMTGPPPAGCP